MLQYLHGKLILTMQKRTTLFAHLVCLSLTALTLAFTACGDKKDDPETPKKEVAVSFKAFSLTARNNRSVNVGGYMTVKETPKGATTTTEDRQFSSGVNVSEQGWYPAESIGRPGDKISVTVGCSNVKSSNSNRLEDASTIEASIEVDGQEVKKVLLNNKTAFSADGQLSATIDFTL